MEQNSFMKLALEEAKKAAARGEVPVGACLVRGSEVLAVAGNESEAQQNPQAHAEMLVLAQGVKRLGKKRLEDCDIYITLEPCAMCAGAIALNHIRRLYYGAADKKMGAIGFFNQPTCHHRPEIYGGIARQEAAALMTAFFQHLRKS